MKSRKPYILALILLVWSCDQNKSGPVDPVATPPTDTAAPAPTPKGTDLFVLSGPAAPVVAGAEQDVELLIKPTPGFKINKRFEWNFEFHPTEGLEMAASSVGMEQVKLEDSKAAIPLKVKAAASGDHTLKATGNFSICNDDKCELYRDREITFKIAATDG